MTVDPACWKRSSSPAPGLQPVFTPDSGLCRASHIHRLNLPAGQAQELALPGLELIAAVIRGRVRLERGGEVHELAKGDAFYLPGGDAVRLTGLDEAVLYLGAAADEGVGAFYVRRLDLALPLGAVHQIHGEPPFAREVFMILDPAMPASRLIAGFTWGADGGWTSWPPHQHEADLEETYCYFDIPPGRNAFHLSYRRDQRLDQAVVHPVADGDFVLAPEGYHPTVAPPGARSCYLWILAAHRHASRRYDLAVPDPRLT